MDCQHGERLLFAKLASLYNLVRFPDPPYVKSVGEPDHLKSSLHNISEPNQQCGLEHADAL